MKYITILIVAAAYFFFGSCNKHEVDLTGFSANVAVVNAIASRDGTIKINFTGHKLIYADAMALAYDYNDGKYANGILNFGLPINTPHSLILALEKDTVKPFFDQTLIFASSDSYTLFVTGTSEAPKPILVKDSLPILADSTTGLRFVNLSPDAGEISINLKGEKIGSEVGRLPYGFITHFKTYPARTANSTLTFEFRDKVTGDLLTAYFYNNNAWSRNVTLIMRGMVQGDPWLEIIRMDN